MCVVVIITGCLLVSQPRRRRDPRIPGPYALSFSLSPTYERASLLLPWPERQSLLSVYEAVSCCPRMSLVVFVLVDELHTPSLPR